MKKAIQPKWYDECQVVCACGQIFTVGSTKPELHVEVCSRCHPFFTGEARYVDTMGRVEKFQRKQAQAVKQKIKKKVAKKREEEQEKHPKSLKEMLLELKKG